MLNVLTPEEAMALIESAFSFLTEKEYVSLVKARGRALAEEIVSHEYVPGFHRSTVDGYAVMASDTFGCSDSLPALLTLSGEVFMGEAAKTPLCAGECIAVPTGGAVPEGADAVVMLEYAEDFGDGTIGIAKPAAPGLNMIFKGDDVFPEKKILPAGRKLTPSDIGALSALGITSVPVYKKPKVGIFSTGDELVPPEETPKIGEIRCVNIALLSALVDEAGAEAIPYGIVKDDDTLIKAAILKAAEECDVVLLSGGSSVGAKDAACRVMQELGEVLLHGIAIKPGKPTLVGKVLQKPVFGLPGHPVAAFFTAELFVKPLLYRMVGITPLERKVSALLSEAVSANHGRAEVLGVRLLEENGTLYAHPIHGKSGLITTLAASDGYAIIPRDCEGLPKHAPVIVTLYPEN